MPAIAFALAASLLILAGFAGLFIYSYWRAAEINRRFPPLGAVRSVDGIRTHYLDIGSALGDAPVVVFLHGASGNLRDPYHAIARRLSPHIRHIYIDRPGHGWSARGGRGMDTPVGQARHVIRLLDELSVEKAVFVGHSWSGALALTIALLYPGRVSGLLLNAPVSHPWPGGVNWYYPIAARPLIGWLFTRALTLPVGERQLACASDKVFWPNKQPADYAQRAGPDLVLAPSRFRANARDIAGLRNHVVAFAPRYGEIRVPVTLITGDKDQILLPWVHSDGLERDIANLRRIDLRNTGHMPHYAAPDLFLAEIERLVTLPAPEIARVRKTG